MSHCLELTRSEGTLDLEANFTLVSLTEFSNSFAPTRSSRDGSARAGGPNQRSSLIPTDRYLPQEYHPNPAVELFCEDRSATMKHIVITEPPPGLWTATIKTYRGDILLDTAPLSISFVIADLPQGSRDHTTLLRSTPWEDPEESVQAVWGNNWGLPLPAGHARCAVAPDPEKTVERCVLSNAMAANRSFFLWTEQGEEETREIAAASIGPLQIQSASEEGFSLYACAGGIKSNCWGAAAPIRVQYLMDQAERRAAGVCDTIVMGSSLVFTLPYLSSPLAVLMAGIVSIAATLHDADLGEGVPDLHAPLLISNAAPPVEATLGPYLPLFSTLTDRPIVSTSELSVRGSVCFQRLFIGTQHLLHLSTEHADERRLDDSAKVWPTCAHLISLHSKHLASHRASQRPFACRPRLWLSTTNQRALRAFSVHGGSRRLRTRR